jgi:hypothetical protein
LAGLDKKPVAGQAIKFLVKTIVGQAESRKIPGFGGLAHLLETTAQTVHPECLDVGRRGFRGRWLENHANHEHGFEFGSAVLAYSRGPVQDLGDDALRMQILQGRIDGGLGDSKLFGDGCFHQTIARAEVPIEDMTKNSVTY